MFDPTAYENMRVVLEGVFYDKDLGGEILVIDRNDIVNMAKLSRAYNISFQLSTTPSRVTCRIELMAGIENLTAELLPSIFSNKMAGCIVTIEFLFEHEEDQSLLMEVKQILRQIWGEKRRVKLTVSREPFTTVQQAQHLAQISFDRIIREDQIDDLIEMTEYVMTTLCKLEQVL